MTKYCVNKDGACQFFVMSPTGMLMCYRDRPSIEYLPIVVVQERVTAEAISNCKYGREIEDEDTPKKTM